MPDSCVICGRTPPSESFWQEVRARQGSIPTDQSTYGPMCAVAAELKLKPQVSGRRLNQCPQQQGRPETAA